MNLRDLEGGPQAFEQGTQGLRAETYLRTYPSLLALARSHRCDDRLLHQLMCVAYGWMPRILRIDPEFLPASVATLALVRDADIHNWHEISIDPLAKCVRSAVGASKILHFVNPEVFPIWDSKVERLRCKRPFMSDKHMSKVIHYNAYLREVHAMAQESQAEAFCASMNRSLRDRLSTLSIEPYSVCNVRAIELAAFSLAIN